MESYDLIIIGAGPAGMSAAVYAGRYRLKTLVIGEMPGGLAAEAVKICNYLSYKQISGMEFTQKMEEHVKDIGVEVKYGKVEGLAAKGERGELFEIKSAEGGVYTAKKLILAMGSEKRKLGLKGEEKFLGKGISYCAVCDAAFFKGKTVGVVGGGDAALTAALLLSEYAKKVYLIYRQEKFFRAETAWVEQVEKNKKIETVFKANVAELKGEPNDNGGRLEGVKLDTGRELKLEGLFVEAGGTPNTELARQLGVELEGRFIKVDKEQKTNVAGVLAAGDITNNPLKQIITAAAEGAIAATAVSKEIRGGKKE